MKKEKQITLIDHGTELTNSYILKSEKCFKSAELLFDNDLFENSISESYYAVYNFLLALWFNLGIKSKTHMGSIYLLTVLFDFDNIFLKLKNLKEQRINFQYYVNNKDESLYVSKKCLLDAQEIIIELKSYLDECNRDKIKELRKKFNEI